MKWQVLRLQSEAQIDEGWRQPNCECGLKDENTGKLVPHGEPLWPGHWTCKSNYDLRKNDAMVYQSSYLLRPKAEGGFLFRKTPPQYYREIAINSLIRYIIVDPSLGRSRNSDLTAMGVIGTGEDQNIYLLDLVWDRLELVARMDHLFRLHRKWKPLRVGYEEYGAIADSSALRDKMERENYRFQIIELGRSGSTHNSSKGDRIRSLVPLASAGRLWFPDPASSFFAPELLVKVKEFIEKQWNRYPGSRFDDVLDMLARVNDPKMNLIYPNRKAVVTQPRHATGSDWMSA